MYLTGGKMGSTRFGTLPDTLAHFRSFQVRIRIQNMRHPKTLANVTIFQYACPAY